MLECPTSPIPHRPKDDKKFNIYLNENASIGEGGGGGGEGETRIKFRWQTNIHSFNRHQPSPRPLSFGFNAMSDVISTQHYLRNVKMTIRFFDCGNRPICLFLLLASRPNRCHHLTSQVVADDFVTIVVISVASLFNGKIDSSFRMRAENVKRCDECQTSNNKNEEN